MEFKLIPISSTDDDFAIVDADDYDTVSRFRWFLISKPRSKYCMTSIGIPDEFGQGTTIKMYMHRMIMSGSIVSADTEIDHINHNGLDNRKSNLRICTSQQNSMNKRPELGCISNFKGVYFAARNPNKPWVSYIVLNGKSKFIGSFQTEIEAASAYDKKAIELFGDFAYLNFEYRFNGGANGKTTA